MGRLHACLAVILCAGCYSSGKYIEHDATDTVGDSTEVPNIPGDCPHGTSTQLVGDFEFPQVDILVVVDDSMSMAEEQANLAETFPQLIDKLLAPEVDPETGRPDHMPVRDLHIGVISTDMGTGGYPVESCANPYYGDDGILQHSPSPYVTGCDSAYALFLSYASDDPDAEQIQWMSTAFGCIAVLGTEGCGFEQQLKAARKALIDHRMGGNLGFLRPESLLAIVFMTDEEDCSVASGNERIFDALDPTLGHMNLRCFNNAYMLVDVGTYVNDFRSLREDPEKLVLTFLVGVPRVIDCEGYGSAIPGCLDRPEMQERIDPVTPGRLVPSCSSTTGEAYPPRRFVQIAQQFGDRALVQSICTDDFSPAIGQLTGKIQQLFVQNDEPLDPVEVARQEDPCLCMADCRIAEALSDSRPCSSSGKACYEPYGPGTGCLAPLVDPSGNQHTVCEIPQAGTTTEPCLSTCDDAGLVHDPAGDGWYYMGEGWRDTSGRVSPSPEVVFTWGSEPENGSTVYLVCCN